jgi:cytochrome c oxidase cbb3-type subunit III
MSFRNATCGVTFVAFLLFLTLAASAQQGKNWANVPPPSPAVKRGQKTFIANCSFCHGPDGAGKTGPDLLRSVLVNHDEGGKQIGVVVHAGRGNGKMPPFPTLTDAEIADIATFLHYQINSVVARFSYKIQGLITGDAKAGEAFFNGEGKCSTCHSPTKDLAGIAKKFQPPDLQHLFIAGEQDDDQVPVPVTVTLPSGESVSGNLLHLDEFNVAIDDSGHYRSWVRDPNSSDSVKVVVHDPLAAHHALLTKLTDADIHNILAYLETLK